MLYVCETNDGSLGFKSFKLCPHVPLRLLKCVTCLFMLPT